MTQIIAISTAHPALPAAIAAHPTPASLPAPATSPAPAPRTGPLRSGNPRGNPNAAPRCGAKARTTGCPCRAPAMPNGRCRLHGGKSTGPRTAQGFANLAKARTTHGNSTAAARAAHRHERTVIIRSRVLVAAMNLRAHLPSAIRARFELGADELAAPPWPVQPPAPTNDDPPPNPLPVPQPPPGAVASDTHKHPPARDARGRFAAPPKPTPRGQQAEREAAREERAMLAPWRAGIKRARMIRRLLTLQAQNARRAQRAQHAADARRPDAITAASLSVAARCRGGAPAPGVYFDPTERNAIHREPTHRPAVPGENPDRTSMQRGTVACPTALNEAPDEAADKTLQRGTVAYPAGPTKPGAASPDKTLKRGTGDGTAPKLAAPAAALSQARRNRSAKTLVHPGTVHAPEGPFRRALLAGTVCNTPDAHRLAATVQRAGGWPVMIAIDAAKQAGQDCRSAAAAARRRLANETDRPLAPLRSPNLREAPLSHRIPPNGAPGDP